MTDTTYSNITENSTNTVISILQGNATLTALCESNNILSYVASRLTKGTGYPHIVVNTETPEDVEWTLNNVKTSVRVSIEILNRDTSINRRMVDAVRSALSGSTGESTSTGVKLRKVLAGGGGSSPTVQDDGSIVYISTVIAMYDWYGVTE